MLLPAWHLKYKYEAIPRLKSSSPNHQFTIPPVHNLPYQSYILSLLNSDHCPFQPCLQQNHSILPTKSITLLQTFLSQMEGLGTTEHAELDLGVCIQNRPLSLLVVYLLGLFELITSFFRCANLAFSLYGLKTCFIMSDVFCRVLAFSSVAVNLGIYRL
jgi:hypothetical protein